ncbi:MAG: GDSL family lipase [Ruminiclostridium sp.]|nr:GDSL family lipase [Ruminiclostridium sp.]
MIKFFKLASAAVTLAMLISVGTSCGGNTSAATTAADTTTAATTEAVTAPSVSEDGTYFPDSAHVKLLGRTHTENDTLWLAQSASGIEFTFKGTACSMDIVSDGSAFGKSDSMARFAVYVNGERKIDQMVDDFMKTIEIFSSDSPEEVTVKVVKLSESGNSSFGIKKLTVDCESGIAPTPEKALKIEFIGDSITCGYGVDDEVKEHHFSTKTEDATKAYAYKTAEKLDADYSLVSYSGHGIISGYTGDASKKNSGQLVPPIYEQFSNSSSKSYYTVDAPWDFSSFVPDYVVINLGTNDDSYVKGNKDKKEEFTTEYVEFLKMVRKDNPDAYIICALGLMGDSLYASVEDAVSRYTSETGDSQVSALHLTPQDMNTNGIAADWHPSEKSHEIAATELSDEIKRLENA